MVVEIALMGSEKIELKYYKFFLLITALLYLNSCKRTDPLKPKSSISENKSSAKSMVLENDTFFLYKKDKGLDNLSSYVQVYETNEKKLYKNLQPKLEDNHFTICNDTEKNKIDKSSFLDIPTRWTEVIYHGDKFYLKYPSDFCTLKQKILTDSCIYERTCEGMQPLKIEDISKINSSQYRITRSYDSNDSKYITITMIDSVNGIAIWEESENDFHFYADVEKFEAIPIAKADCNGKCPYEIKSQEVDYLELIRETTG